MSRRSASRIAATVALLGLAGCHRAAADAPPSAPVIATPAPSTPAAEVDPTPRLRVVITPTLEPTPRVGVVIEVGGAPEPDQALIRWSLPGPLADESLAPTIHDADGPIEATIDRDDDGLHLTLARAPSPPLTLAYSLAPTPVANGLARIELDEVHLFATGEALLLLPDAALDRRLPLAVELVADALAPDPDALAGLPPLRAASSFAAAPSFELDGWPFELRRAAFVAGTLEAAQFDSMAGDDRWLGLGPTRFDHRWSAAELAGVRSLVDATIGMPTLDPLVTILVSGSRSAAEPGISAELRGRGLVILADHNAYWDAAARMSAAQALAARWLGGRVRLVEPGEPEHARARALWFEAGATRFVARELLFELGLLADEDYAAELDMLELELASSPLRERTLAELAALIADADADPASRAAAADASALLLARGAMYMAWLDAELRGVVRSWGSIGALEILRVVIATAIAEQRRDVALTELFHLAAFKLAPSDPPEAAVAAAFEAVVVRGERPPLRADAFGPCFRPRVRKLRRFELGFVDSSRIDDARPSFVALDPDGPAAQAGLRADDQLVSLDYVAGDPEHPVRLELARGDATVTLEYRPAGPARRVTQWQRVADVPPEACVR